MLDLKELERKLDEALNNETPESLKEWLNKKREEERIADLESNSARSTCYASEAVPACGHCKYFVLNTYEDGFISEMGNCKYEVKFPDSTFARCAGTKKTMNKKDGRYCPCYESKPEA